MRVLLYLRQLAPGGAERQFVQLAGGLARLGHRVVLATLFPGGALEGELDAAVERLSLFDERGRRAGALRQVAGAPSRLARVVSEHGIDVVYSALYLNNAVAFRGARLAGAPVVWGLRSVQQGLGLKRRLWFEYCRRRSPMVAGAISNSHAGAEAHARLGFRFRRQVVVPNGIDTDRFRRNEADGAAIRAEWGIAPEAPLVGLVGRLCDAKDHPTFLEAAALASRERSDLRFVCVGGGEPAFAQRLRRRGRELGLDGKLVWAGSRSDVSSVYSALDLSVLTSVVEGFANVIGESMSCEVPVVVTDVGDSGRILGDEARVLPPGDPAAHAAAWIRTLALGREARRDLARRDRERVVSEFGLQACFERTGAFLEAAISSA